MTDEHEALDPNVEWIVSEARRPVVVSAEARQRLLAMVKREPRPRRQSAPLAWLTRSRPIALPPLAMLAAAAGLVGIGVIAGFAINRDGRAPTEQGTPVAEYQGQLPDSLAPRAVKFVLVAPQASRVALVGDFNGWDRGATPALRQQDGSWIAFAPLRPGRHEYSFVVDGNHVIADPSAPMAPDDGYGQRNSVVVVTGASS